MHLPAKVLKSNNFPRLTFKFFIKKMLETITKAIFVPLDSVKIDITETENTNIYELGGGDVGMFIGRYIKNIGAIRTLLSAETAKAGGKRSLLEIIE
jgi:predicted RNA-binding protein YlqC (UPF0109 family)